MPIKKHYGRTTTTDNTTCPKFQFGDLIVRKAQTPRYNLEGELIGYENQRAVIQYRREPRPGVVLYGYDITGFGVVWDHEDQIELYEHE